MVSSLIDMGFIFLKESWNISVTLSKYIVLFILLTAIWRNKEDLRAALRKSFGSLIVKIGPMFILGILAATSVSLIFESFIIVYTVFLLVSGLFLYFDFPEASLEDLSDLKEKVHLSISILFLIVLLLSFLPLNSLLPKLVAMIFYGIVFWRI